MEPPVIGIMLFEMPSNGPEAIHLMQLANTPYFTAIERAGGLPIGLPQTEQPETLEALLARCDGFLLPGGLDVDPRFYGQDPHPLLGRVNLKSDQAWASVVHTAAREKKPVLGICRGLQLINTALGGTLYQDMSQRSTPSILHAQTYQNRGDLMHQVSIEPDSRLAKVLNTTRVYTNTLHHQCVNTCGAGLRVVAHTSDGVCEALESDDGLFLAVQWHPEELCHTAPCMEKLFSDLIQRAVL